MKATQATQATPDAVLQAVLAGGLIQGLKNNGEDKAGHYVVIPPELQDDEPMAIGPFVDAAAAQTFLEAEVGAAGARVVEVSIKL